MYNLQTCNLCYDVKYRSFVFLIVYHSVYSSLCFTLPHLTAQATQYLYNQYLHFIGPVGTRLVIRMLRAAVHNVGVVFCSGGTQL